MAKGVINLRGNSSNKFSAHLYNQVALCYQQALHPTSTQPIDAELRGQRTWELISSTNDKENEFTQRGGWLISEYGLISKGIQYIKVRTALSNT